ncbi:hypothetical protein VIN30_08980 [Adlercreutzia sp. R7]|uniref:DUF3791 domain-containing protein n=1 Tax=Adlercreutzia wanghongyangiae TaxID=3111451 RepID=A0ABU6IJD6_9ACTN|nr:hypothetical protein [Adlercreutzia sp. R7]
MSDAGKQAVLQMKYARVIDVMASLGGITPEEAMDLFYNAPLMPLIQEGVADLHCRSDEYLAKEILRDAGRLPVGSVESVHPSSGE